MKWIETPTRGVRYREHPTRKRGVRKDRYFAIRYQKDGKRKEEGLGWSSEGWTTEKAVSELSKLKEAAQKGEGPTSLAEKRAIETKRKEAETEEQKQVEKDAITLKRFFNDTYLPQAKADKKTYTSQREEGLFVNWIDPVMGHIPFKEIVPFHMEALKKKMAEKGQSARSIEYALALLRQVFNTARRLGMYEADSPTKSVKKPRVDNGRMRFLTHKEARRLLQALKAMSLDVHDMTLLSLNCGLRFGEIASLTWQDVDLIKGQLTIRDAKAGSRYAFLTEQAVEMLNTRIQGKPSDYVFPKKKKGGGKMDKISHTFFRTIDQLKFNDGIDDPRLKICFHSCRHTYASWLIEQGQDLYTVQRLLGHKTNVMTQRYAHLAENKLRGAARALSQALQLKDKEDQSDSVLVKS